jgi:hypothetical protein
MGNGQPSEGIEVAYDLGWTDGLPVVPPTRELVDPFLATTAWTADRVVAELPPNGGKATVEKIAINAVMAGCRPEYLPVILAAVSAISDERFSLQGVLGSTHMATPVLIVNGPIREQLKINHGGNLLGPGHRANATIGRAVNLLLRNVGGSYPGTTSKSVFGQGGRFSCCFAEDEDSNPWEPLHVERGFKIEDSTVTVFPGASPQNIYNPGADDASALLETMADGMAALGNVQLRVMGDTLVVFSPHHVRLLSAAGLKKTDVKQYLFDRARTPVEKVDLMLGKTFSVDLKRKLWPRWLDFEQPGAMIPVVRRPEDILVMVAGGAGGPHSLYMSGWGSRAVTRRIPPDKRPGD